MSLISNPVGSNSSSNDEGPDGTCCENTNHAEMATLKGEMESIKFNHLEETASVQCFFAAAVINNWKVRYVKEKFDPLFEDFYLKAKEYTQTELEGEFHLKQTFYNGECKRYRWMQAITIHFKRLGFIPLDECPYIFRKSLGYTDVYLLMFVDDIFIASKSDQQMETAISDLCEGSGSVIPAYPNPSMVPTLEVEDKRLQINCEAFINAMLENFIFNVKRTYFEYDIPLLPSHFAIIMGETSPPNLYRQHKDRTDRLLYRQIVQGLRYLAYHTRPDIALATAFLEKGIDDVRELHWKMLLQVLHYLHQTTTVSMNFENSIESNLTAYYDVYFNSDEPGFQILGFCLVYKKTLITWSVEVHDPVSFPRKEYIRPNKGHEILKTVYAKINALEPLLKEFSLPTKQLSVYGPCEPSKCSGVYSSYGSRTIISVCKDSSRNVAHMFTRPIPQNNEAENPFSRFLTNLRTQSKSKKKNKYPLS